MINPGIIGSTAGVGLGLAGSAIYAKAKGKPAGVPGSTGHILTNDKLDKKAKGDVVKEQLIEGVKDTAKVGKVVVGSAAAASLVAGCSNKAAGLLHNAKSTVGGLLSKVSINDKNLKEIVKNNGVYKKLNALPTPAKAAIAAGAAALALVAPIAGLVNAQKSGYIEGKHEANTLARNLEKCEYASKMGCVA